MYADYGYYISSYLLGRDPIVPDLIFPYWEKQAERVLNQHTHSRLVADCGLITDEVRDCTCELTELLYQADQRAQQDAAQGGPLQSYSNDGESGTFALAESIYTESGKQKKIREIIRRHLSDTGLLYAGVE